MSTTLPQIDEIDDQMMMEYLHHFLQIADFKKIQNGKQLLLIIKDNPNHSKVKSAVRKILGLFQTDSPGAKVCSLQFLKEAMETNCWCVVESIQRSLLPKVVQVTEYRPHMRSLQRGSSYFINNFDKNVTDEQVSNLIKLSSTFFRMIHECVYVWGALYFPGTSFDRMRIKLMKKFDFPKYPEQFKFFTDKKIENFKLNCKDVIKKMKDYDDEVMSKSSIEKKRETSVKPSRVSSSINNKNSRSQSTQQLPPNKKSTRQMQEEVNSKRKINNQSPTKKIQAEAKKQNSSRKQSQSLSNSSLLRKKNSFSEVEVAKIQTQQKYSPKRQQAKKVNIQNKKSMDQALSHKLRFKTISQQSDSQVGRYSVKESNEQSSQQFSEGDYLYQNRTNESPRSQLDLRKQKNDMKLPLKKYISEEITLEAPVKKVISLNEIKRDNKKQHKNDKSGQYNEVNRDVQQVQIRKEKENKKGIRQQMIVETEKEKPTKSINVQDQINKLNEKKVQNKVLIKSVPKLPLPRQQKFQQERKKRKDQSARKKFISSEEQNTQKQKQTGLNIQNQAYSDLNHQENIDNIKVNANNLIKNENKQVLPQKNTIVKQINQQAPPKIPEKQKEEVINPKPLRMAKPQKIKGSTSSKTVFQGNQYSIVQIVPQAKIVTKQISIDTISNIIPLKKKKQVKEKSKPKISFDKDIYKMVQEIEDTEIMTIQLKIVDSELAINKHHQVKNNKTLIQRQKEELQSQLSQKHQSLGQEVNNKQQKIVKIQNIQKQQIRISSTKQIQQASNITIKQDKQIKVIKQIAKPDPIRIYSPKRKDQNLQFESPLYSYRKKNNQTSEAEAKENTARNNRLKKNQQVCMIIHPKDDNLSEVQIKSRKESLDQVKNLLKDQIAEEFAQLRNTFFSQQENIYQSVQTYTSKLKSQISHKEKPAVDCGIQAKIRQKHKKRVASTRKYRMFDDTEEDRLKNNLNQTISNTIQNDKLTGNKAFDSTKKISLDTTLKGKQTRKSSKNKVSLNPGDYEPNTLLYALYQRRSLLND